MLIGARTNDKGQDESKQVISPNSNRAWWLPGKPAFERALAFVKFKLTNLREVKLWSLNEDRVLPKGQKAGHFVAPKGAILGKILR